jgi:transitional endoplasmic reticulum ATPase
MKGGARRIPALRAALAVDPGDNELRNLLAESLVAAGKNHEAIEEYRLLLTSQPDDAESTLRLAQAYAATGQGGPARSLLSDLEARGEMTPGAWRLQAAIVGLGGGNESPPASEITDIPAPLVPMTPGPTDSVELTATTPTAPAVDARLERPAITFEDVGGMEAIKEAIRLKIIYPTQNAELYRAYGKVAGGGLLMYGPPGCGKTYLARATAGEVGASFLSVGVADVLDMWLGSSERNLREIFQSARAHRPCVIFFDEIDALAASRADFRNTAGRTVINQFLAELDGVGGDNSGLLILGATNAPWHLDSAFRRPGRFDEVLFVPPPDAEARRAILEVQVRNRPVQDLDLSAVIKQTDGWSGADLKGLVDRALERKLAAALRDGRISPLVTADLLAAAKGTFPTTIEWFATVRNYLMYANESGIYDPVRPYLKK